MDLFKLIKNPEVLNVIARYVANRPEEFTGLDDQIATLLIDMWFWHEVKENRYYYTNLRTATKRRIFMK